MITHIHPRSQGDTLLPQTVYRVTMRSGLLTRDKWVRNEVQPGELVKDTDGRVFRIVEIKPVPQVGMGTTTLTKVTSFDAAED